MNLPLFLRQLRAELGLRVTVESRGAGRVELLAHEAQRVHVLANIWPAVDVLVPVTIRVTLEQDAVHRVALAAGLSVITARHTALMLPATEQLERARAAALLACGGIEGAHARVAVNEAMGAAPDPVAQLAAGGQRIEVGRFSHLWERTLGGRAV